MSKLLVDQLITPVTPKQAKERIYTTLAVLGISTTSWISGSVVRLIIAVVSILAATLSNIIATIARMSFLSTATGDWKTLVASNVFGTDRLAPTFATGTIQLTNSQGGSFNPAVGEIVVEGSNGKKYRNLEVFALGPNSSTSTTFAAIEAGTASNAGVGTVTSLVTTMTGVTVSNTTAFVARDEESDDELDARALAKPRALSPNGTRQAYYWAAVNAVRSDETAVGVNRVTVSPYSSTGDVTVTVATAAGAVPGDVEDPDTDLGAVAVALQAVTPQGVDVTTRSATTTTIDWAISIAMPEGRTAPLSTLRSITFDALEAWLSSSSMPIGGVSLPSVGIYNKIFRSTAQDIVSQAVVAAGYSRPLLVTVTTPASDPTLDDTDVATVGTVAVST